LEVSDSLSAADVEKPVRAPNAPDGVNTLIVPAFATWYHEGEDVPPPSRLDFRGSDGLEQFRKVSGIWHNLKPGSQDLWRQQLEIVLPQRKLSGRDIALLPGGAVTLRDPSAILVCEPAEAVSFDEAQTKRLRNAVRARQDATTLMHTRNGVVACARMPNQLPPQAVTVLPNGVRPPLRMTFTGPVMIQWGLRGAVAWPLIAAPAALALAASIAASPVFPESDPASPGPKLGPEKWHAAGAEARSEFIRPALSEHFFGLLGRANVDHSPPAILDACVAFCDTLAERISDGLAMMPSCMLGDPDAIPGAPPASWQQAIELVHASRENVALLRLDQRSGGIASIRALRHRIPSAELFVEPADGGALLGQPMPLHSDAAVFLANKARPFDQLMLAVPLPATPVDLYALAHDAVSATGGEITAFAPCWGFRHRIGPSGDEAGNASWFGMGAGLDEADALHFGYVA
jgi:hypothetical protein